VAISDNGGLNKTSQLKFLDESDRKLIANFIHCGLLIRTLVTIYDTFIFIRVCRFLMLINVIKQMNFAIRLLQFYSSARQLLEIVNKSLFFITHFLRTFQNAFI